MRDRFLSATTHELGQPLTAIRLAAQLLRRRAKQAGAEADTREELDEIDVAVAKSMAMVGELVELARLQAGH